MYPKCIDVYLARVASSVLTPTPYLSLSLYIYIYIYIYVYIYVYIYICIYIYVYIYDIYIHYSVNKFIDRCIPCTSGLLRANFVPGAKGGVASLLPATEEEDIPPAIYIYIYVYIYIYIHTYI